MSGVQVLVGANVLRQQRGDPSGSEHEDEVEERVVVLSVRLLVVVAVVWALVFIIGVLVQSRSGQSTRLDSATESFGTHSTAAFRLGRDHIMTAFLGFKWGVFAATLVGAKSESISGSTGGGVGAGDKGDDGAEDDGGLASAVRADERVAVLVIGLHGDG